MKVSSVQIKYRIKPENFVQNAELSNVSAVSSYIVIFSYIINIFFMRKINANWLDCIKWKSHWMRKIKCWMKERWSTFVVVKRKIAKENCLFGWHFLVVQPCWYVGWSSVQNNSRIPKACFSLLFWFGIANLSLIVISLTLAKKVVWSKGRGAGKCLKF